MTVKVIHVYVSRIVSVHFTMLCLLHSTAGAMQGKTSYKTSLEARLNLFRPSRSAVAQFIAKHPPAFTPKVEYVFTYVQVVINSDRGRHKLPSMLEEESGVLIRDLPQLRHGDP